MLPTVCGAALTHLGECNGLRSPFSPVAAVVCYTAGLCAWNLRRQVTGRSCNSNPGTGWAVERNGSPADIASVRGFSLALDCSFWWFLPQHRARQRNEWIHWHFFRYISFLLAIIFLSACVNMPRCHMLLNRLVWYTPQPGDLVGFDLCVLFCHKSFICSQNTQAVKTATHGHVILNFKWS